MVFFGFKRPGLITGAFAFGYGISRFIIEYFRVPDPQFFTDKNPYGFAFFIGEFGLTMGQPNGSYDYFWYCFNTLFQKAKICWQDMKLLKFFLYSILFIAPGWTFLIFGGPSILAWAAASYSDGRVSLKNVEISPRLQITIGRVEFDFGDKSGKSGLFGLSRSVKLIGQSLVTTLL